MKRLLCFALALALAFALCACSGIPKTDYSEYGDSVVIDIGDVTAKAGETVDVPISIANNKGAAAIAVELAFDTSMLQPQSAKAVGKLSGTGFFLSNAGDGGSDDKLAEAGISSDAIIGDTGGNVKVLWFNTENVTGDGEIMVVTFKVADGASGKIDITAKENADDIVTEDQQNISDKVYLAGSVTVG